MNYIIKTIKHYAEYVLLRTVQILISIVPRTYALYLGSIVGNVTYRMKIYRKIVDMNMQHVACWPPLRSETIIHSLYRNIGKYTVDFLRPAFPIPSYRLHGFEKIEPLFHQGKGTIVILGHLGNWELLAAVFGKMTGKLAVVAKPMNNPLVDQWLLKKRTALSVTTIYSGQALRKIISELKKDNIVAILIDQNMRKHGNVIPFLGKEARTVSTVAGLVQKTNCNVISIQAIMDTNRTYDIELAPVDHNDCMNVPDSEQKEALQKKHNDIISSQIMAHPDHWFGWFHKRFKGCIDYKQ